MLGSEWMRAAVLVLAFAAGPALAQPPMTAEEFDANVTGRTITYTYLGEVYSVEQYLPGRKVRTSHEDLNGNAVCSYTYWYPDGDDICFHLDGSLDPSCWEYRLVSGAIVAWEAGVANHTLLEASRTDNPIICTDEDL
jgi:hypothetical protein